MSNNNSNKEQEKIKLSKILRNTLFFLSTILDDILIIAGVSIIIIQTFRINEIAGAYVLGISLLLLGFYLANKE